MKISQLQWTDEDSWVEIKENSLSKEKAQLVFFFTAKKDSENLNKFGKELNEKFPSAHIVGCSSAGHILDDDVYDEGCSATAVEFESSSIEVVTSDLSKISNPNLSVSYVSGEELAKGLKKEGLAGLVVISDGLQVNGSDLVKGIRSVIPESIPLSGGLAGDGGDFKETFVYSSGSAKSGQVALLGFYGDNLSLGHGSLGGWDEFGPVRKISDSEGNILKGLDDEPALSLYKRYLGDEDSKKLPGSALLFPILVYPEGKKEEALVRTILSVDEKENTMTFAGDVPKGWCAQLMRANFDHLIEAAGGAAKLAKLDDMKGDSLALLISCVGRKMVLGQKTADEIESVQEILGDNAHQVGFYSYGEISPISGVTDSCALHNQTMTITVITEKK